MCNFDLFNPFVLDLDPVLPIFKFLARGVSQSWLRHCVKVITDEQIEVLRKQISIYAIICEQLIEMHRALTTHQDSIAGMHTHTPSTHA
ncbi:unnamed protein product [Triticum turgidum subsp. durum]|uniref:Uncharacterized protein n=1 Tax=Triticum turgidum subsp. durum TaxID=4567 RepID=A0A9R0VF83_TRITD|nr:unnamed protein product [Triticum turgidum subsp. durum]